MRNSDVSFLERQDWLEKIWSDGTQASIPEVVMGAREHI